MVEVCLSYSDATLRVAVEPLVSLFAVILTLALAFASLIYCCSGHSAVVATPKTPARKSPVVIRLPSGSLVSIHGAN